MVSFCVLVKIHAIKGMYQPIYRWERMLFESLKNGHEQRNFNILII